ncbi:hypothetical protein J6590_106602, partial [Homalodisca vitripennis]
MLVHPDVTKKIVLACCVLHNFIRKREGRLADVFEEMLHLTETDEDREPSRARASKAALSISTSSSTSSVDILLTPSRDGTLLKPLVDRLLNAQLKQNTDHAHARTLLSATAVARHTISTSSLTPFR